MRYALLLVGSLGFVHVGFVHAAEQPAGTSGKDFGVSSYKFGSSAAGLQVDVLDREGGSMGTATITYKTGGVAITYQGTDGRRVAVDFAPDLATTSFTDLVTHKTGTSTYDPLVRQWHPDKQFAIWSKTRREFQLAFAIAGDFEEQAAKLVDNRKQAGVACQKNAGIDPQPNAVPPCDGCIGTVTMWATTEPLCCNVVADKVNMTSCCINSDCWGCCYYFGCSDACAIGKYGCICSGQGRGCGIPN